MNVMRKRCAMISRNGGQWSPKLLRAQDDDNDEDDDVGYADVYRDDCTCKQTYTAVRFTSIAALLIILSVISDVISDNGRDNDMLILSVCLSVCEPNEAQLRCPANVFMNIHHHQRKHHHRTIHPADSDTFNDGDDENSEPGAIVIHQLQHVHASLYTQVHTYAVMRWLQLRHRFDWCSIIRPRYDDSTLWPTSSGLLHCGLNK